MTELLAVIEAMQNQRWEEAHRLVQRDTSALAAWLHGILHIQEGDLEDAEYWYGQAGRNFRMRGTLEQELDAIKLTIQQASVSPQSGPK